MTWSCATTFWIHDLSRDESKLHNKGDIVYFVMFAAELEGIQ